MKWIRYLFSLIWRFWFLIVFIGLFICFIPPLFFFTGIRKNEKIVAYLSRYLSKLVLLFSFIFPKVEWEEKLDKNACYIFCPNHVSALDIPLVLATIPIPLQYMGKAELTRIPLFGWFYKKNAVIVNRSKIKDAYVAFLNAGEQLDLGFSMCIFPEGGIPPQKVFLKKFKNGPFRLAIEQKRKIIPITMPDNKHIFPQEYYKGRPGIVRIKVHAAIQEVKNISVENLKNNVYNTIFEQLKKYGSNK